jgi:hypothetical protein
VHLEDHKQGPDEDDLMGSTHTHIHVAHTHRYKYVCIVGDTLIPHVHPSTTRCRFSYFKVKPGTGNVFSGVWEEEHIRTNASSHAWIALTELQMEVQLTLFIHRNKEHEAMVYDVWCLVYGIQNVAYGIWKIEDGRWKMTYAL